MTTYITPVGWDLLKINLLKQACIDYCEHVRQKAIKKQIKAIDRSDWIKEQKTRSKAHAWEEYYKERTELESFFTGDLFRMMYCIDGRKLITDLKDLAADDTFTGHRLTALDFNLIYYGRQQ